MKGDFLGASPGLCKIMATVGWLPRAVPAYTISSTLQKV